MELVRGQKVKLRDLTSASAVEVSLYAGTRGRAFADISCFGLDAEGKLSDDRYFIFYNCRSSPCGSLEAEGAGDGGLQVFRIDLSRLPQTIRRLVFTATVDEGTLEDIADGAMCINGEGRQVARFAFSGSDFASERAVMVGEIYFKDVWRLAAVGQGFSGDLSALLKHFGGSELQGKPAPVPAPIPALTPAGAPAAAGAAAESPAVGLSKVILEKRGSRKTLSLNKTGNSDTLKPIHVNLNWDQSKSVKKSGFGLGRAAEAPDLDLGCMFLMDNGMKGVIQPLGDRFGARDRPPYIYLDKDDGTGAASEGENLYITRPELVRKVLIFALIYEGAARFSTINGRLTLNDSDGNEIFIKLDSPDSKHTFCAIALIERQGDGLEVIKVERYFQHHEEADKEFGFGFRWVAGEK